MTVRIVYNKIKRIAGDCLVVEAKGVRYGEIATVHSSHGTSLAEVVRIDSSSVFLQVFAGTSGVCINDEVRFLNTHMKVSRSGAILGRIFNGAGEPRDNGPALHDDMTYVRTQTINPVKRKLPSTMIHTGIPMIDMFNTLVWSQKITIFTTSREPHNELMARIALQSGVDVIVFGGMGLRYEEYLFFKDSLQSANTLGRSSMFVHTAADPVVECLLVPDMSLCAAEGFALNGKNVLVLLTDMRNYCDALKEVSIIMEQIPSNRGYPGDLYSRLAFRYEKAVDFEGAGSVSILSVTTMPGNDTTHPIPDNTGYITEGQYYLHNGRIEPFGSLSRLKQFVNKDTREDHRALMDAMLQLYTLYQETLEKKAMGFKMTAWDNKLFNYGKRFESTLMDLSVNIPLTEALDKGWAILAESFTLEETGLRTQLIKRYWPTGGM